MIILIQKTMTTSFGQTHVTDYSNSTSLIENVKQNHTYAYGNPTSLFENLFIATPRLMV